MKVTEIKTHIFGFTYDRPWGSAQTWFDRAKHVVVQVLTDEGIVGWGECDASPEVCRAAIDAVLAPFLRGQDPFQSVVIWGEMYHRVKDQGTKGVMLATKSGIDTALWDIKGKATGLPVHRLLGGCIRDRVLTYATGFYFTKDPEMINSRREAECSYE